jgi:hypothetical protein
MSPTISTITHAIWAWLPDLTTGLRFATALSGFYPTATLIIQRLHHRMPHRRPDHPSHAQEDKPQGRNAERWRGRSCG